MNPSMKQLWDHSKKTYPECPIFKREEATPEILQCIQDARDETDEILEALSD